MNRPLISVIVPVYKTEAYLPQCLDSICSQTYRNLEIICVDDESPDRGGEILEEYARRDPRIKVIHRKNGGLSAARNSGLAAATGEWVTGVDSDDYLEPDIYEKAVEMLSEQVDILVFGTQCVYENGAADATRDAYFDLPDEEMLKRGNSRLPFLNVCFWNKLWRRSFVEKIGITFPEGMIHEDEYFYRCLAPYAGGIGVLRDTGYYYRQRQGSIMLSGKSELDRYRDRMMISEAILQTHISKGIVEEGKEFILSFWFIRFQFLVAAGVQAADVMKARKWNRKIIAGHQLLRVYHMDGRLLQLLPNPWWQRLFLKVYSNRISYRFFGLPLFSVIYENNRPVRRESAWVNAFKGIARTFSRLRGA